MFKRAINHLILFHFLLGRNHVGRRFPFGLWKRKCMAFCTVTSMISAKCCINSQCPMPMSPPVHALLSYAICQKVFHKLHSAHQTPFILLTCCSLAWQPSTGLYYRSYPINLVLWLLRIDPLFQLTSNRILGVVLFSTITNQNSPFQSHWPITSRPGGGDPGWRHWFKCYKHTSFIHSFQKWGFDQTITELCYCPQHLRWHQWGTIKALWLRWLSSCYMNTASTPLGITHKPESSKK